MKPTAIQYADDDITPLKRLAQMRAPSLSVGLVMGIALSFVVSRFEQVLNANIRVAFFLPFIVYIAAAVGAQTQTIYARALRDGKASFKLYFIKESLLGVILGAFTAVLTAVITYVWLGSTPLTLAVSLGTFGAIAPAPLIALLAVEMFELEHSDPAVGAGPIATVVQDMLSIVIYGLIASAIIL